jgi:hypothetical protein
MARILLRSGQEPDALRRLTQSERHVAREILAYFLRNPRVADNAEGVARWRMMDERVRQSVRETFVAIKWLVANGYLEESSSPATGEIFYLNSDHAEEARNFVAADPPPRPRRTRR